jgi:hypothetical protein
MNLSLEMRLGGAADSNLRSLGEPEPPGRAERDVLSVHLRLVVLDGASPSLLPIAAPT